MRFKSTFAAAALLAVAAAFMALPRPRSSRRRARCTRVRQLPPAVAQLDPDDRARRRERCKGTQCQACHGDATQHLQDPKKYKPVGRSPRRPRPRPRSRRCACRATPAAAARELVRRQAPQGRRDVRQLPQRPPDAVGGQHQADPLRRVRGGAVHDDVRSLAYKNCVECHRDTRRRS